LLISDIGFESTKISNQKSHIAIKKFFVFLIDSSIFVLQLFHMLKGNILNGITNIAAIIIVVVVIIIPISGGGIYM